MFAGIAAKNRRFDARQSLAFGSHPDIAFAIDGMNRYAAKQSVGEVENVPGGILHRLRRENPSGDYVAANEAAVCRYMKTITPAKLLRTLREGVHEVRVEPGVADRARAAIERMVAIG